jgi:FlaA1/EpsC-like NDP-sugar epimerase
MVSPNQLASIATRRRADLFQPDIEARAAELREKIAGKSFLIIGGAGSIGSNTIKALAPFKPARLHIIDQSENNLAELVRDLRNSGLDSSIALRALPIDFGSSIMRRFLREEKARYDYVLNFAALKHVRSEKDTCSLLQMYETNLVKQKRLLQWLVDDNISQNYFCVSTDKAANPVNLMGASKRLMELLAFGLRPSPALRVTSARFANVAFSDGSLLHSFRQRLEKQQPLAAPTSTQRYFVSLRESGQICLLASILAPAQHIFIPRLDPASDLHLLEDIAAEFLKLHNLKPKTYTDENAASANVAADTARGEYPLLLTPLDTSGEKPYEEFIGEGEQAIEVGLQSLLAIPFHAAPNALQRLSAFMEIIEFALANPDISFDKAKAVQSISETLPEFSHIETGRTLDDRR